MESQPQNPEFRNNPENFHPCAMKDELVVVTKRPGSRCWWPPGSSYLIFYGSILLLPGHSILLILFAILVLLCSSLKIHIPRLANIWSKKYDYFLIHQSESGPDWSCNLVFFSRSVLQLVTM